jgi:arabinan endo-1,5-alpha-L-arabinosidase
MNRLAARWSGVLLLAVLAILSTAAGQTPTGSDGESKPRQDDPPPRRRFAPDPEKVHDPSTIVIQDGAARLFCTGRGISLVREDAAGKWLPEGRVFAEAQFPAWHEKTVPGNRGHLWAPDVIRLGERFFVYYSVSTFGKNTSAIGLAVGGSVDPASPQWRWEDRGPVVVSRAGDRFNAIDPAVFKDATDGTLWMTFGSFWDGIHLVELDPETGLARDPKGPPRRLAWAPEIEAPFLHQRDGFYYLFINWGKCCRGVNSTYEIRVGRSRKVTGPYLDREGVDLVERGGTLVLASQGRWIGPGHASLLERDNRQWLVHHYYDRELNGRSRLRMAPLVWDAEGWPVVTPAGD